QVNLNRLVHCSGTARGGFFRKLTQRRTTCSKARRLMKTWIRASGFGTRRRTKGITNVFVYRCRLLMLRGVDNQYGRNNFTNQSHGDRASMLTIAPGGNSRHRSSCALTSPRRAARPYLTVARTLTTRG